MPDPSPIIRPYQPADRAALFQIAADTAFFGAPIERYLEDRRIFLDAFYAYYTDYEPEHAWVACLGTQVVGFLTGCLNTRHQMRVTRGQIIPRVAWRWLRGGYQLGPLGWRYLRALLGAGLRGEFPTPDLARHPAHLHINLAEAARGQGLGRGLMQAYLQQLHALGVRGVHLETSSLNVAACALYASCGFRLHDARPTRMWAGIVDGPLENRCYALDNP